MLLDISAEFNKNIKEILKKQSNEVMEYVLHDERKNVAINHTCEQVLIYERRYHAQIDLRKRNYLIKAAASLFCLQSIKYKEQQMLTDCEKMRLQGVATQKQEMKDQITMLDPDLDAETIEFGEEDIE